MFGIFKRCKFIALNNALLAQYRGLSLYQLFKKEKNSKRVRIKAGKPSDKIKEEFDVIISFRDVNDLKNWRIQ